MSLIVKKSKIIYLNLKFEFFRLLNWGMVIMGLDCNFKNYLFDRIYKIEEQLHLYNQKFNRSNNEEKLMNLLKIRILDLKKEIDFDCFFIKFKLLNFSNPILLNFNSFVDSKANSSLFPTSIITLNDLRNINVKLNYKFFHIDSIFSIHIDDHI